MSIEEYTTKELETALEIVESAMAKDVSVARDVQDIIDMYADLGVEPAYQRQQPEVTPEEYRTAAKVARSCGHVARASVWESEAARLEAESARDEEAERYAKVYHEAGPSAHKWVALYPETQATLIDRMRAVLDQLAADGRLLPEGGKALTAEQWADVRIACGADDVKSSERFSAEARLRRMAYGEPPEGASKDCWVNHGCDGTACDFMHGDTPPAVSVPDDAPDGTPEKPWPTVDDIPPNVRVRPEQYTGPSFYTKAESGAWTLHPNGDYDLWNTFPINKFAPFVRVDGDKG